LKRERGINNWSSKWGADQLKKKDCAEKNGLRKTIKMQRLPEMPRSMQNVWG
jgi:hypothetical protein